MRFGRCGCVSWQDMPVCLFLRLPLCCALSMFAHRWRWGSSSSRQMGFCICRFAFSPLCDVVFLFVVVWLPAAFIAMSNAVSAELHKCASLQVMGCGTAYSVHHLKSLLSWHESQ